jgi:hypothetical protein
MAGLVPERSIWSAISLRQPRDPHPSASSHQRALRSSGALRSGITVASPKSPVAGSPVRLKATAPQPGPIAVTHDMDFASRKSVASGKRSAARAAALRAHPESTQPNALEPTSPLPGPPRLRPFQSIHRLRRCRRLNA